MNEESCFHLYEDRYRRLREQSVTFWTPEPAEQARTVEEVDRFLSETSLEPATTSLVEFGCGEGFLAEHIIERGYRYTGIDLSPSAIDYTRGKYENDERTTFIPGDVADLKDIPDSSFDAGLDIMFLHMLIEDDHRRNYLSEVRRVLKPSAPALFIQILRAGDTIEDITDVTGLAGTPGKNPHSTDLPRIPARFKSETGYYEELEKAGFIIESLFVKEHRCIIHLRNMKD